MTRTRLSPVGRFAIYGLVAVTTVAVILAGQISALVEKNAIADAALDVKNASYNLIVSRLSPSDLASPLTGSRLEEFDQAIKQGVLSDRIAQVNIWNNGGQIVYSDNAGLIGQRFPESDELQKALQGETVAHFIELRNTASIGEKPNLEKFLEVYVPVRLGDNREILAVYEAYYPWAPSAARIAETQTVALMWLGIGSLILYLFALVMLGGATRTISHLLRQTEHRAEDLERANESLQEMHLSTLETLAATVEARDPYTYGHSLRVTEYALAFAKELSYGNDDLLASLRRAAVLHDIGKIGVSDSILRKPGKLDPWEYEEMKQHSEIGFALLLRMPFLREELQIIRHHHERYDGLGYPAGLEKEEIPLGARILLVADALDAMTSDRPYRTALSLDAARGELEKYAGIMFCPTTVQAALKVIDTQLAPKFAAANINPKTDQAQKQNERIPMSVSR